MKKKIEEYGILHYVVLCFYTEMNIGNVENVAIYTNIKVIKAIDFREGVKDI